MNIHVISNGEQDLAQFACMAGKIEPYVSYFHLREKSRTAKDILAGIKVLREQGVPLSKIIINDRADIAYLSGAYGVQLASHSLPLGQVKRAFSQLRVGRSVHSLEEAKRACEQGAEYIFYGHIYTTSSKLGLQPRGIKELTRIVEAVTIPVIAIGGINPEHVAEVCASGASGIAMMSGITEAPDPLIAIQSYLKGGGNIDSVKW